MFEMWFIHLKWGFKLLNVEANQTSAWDWYSRPTFSCTGFIHEGIIFFFGPTCQCDSHPGNSTPTFHISKSLLVRKCAANPNVLFAYGWVKTFRNFDRSPGLVCSVCPFVPERASAAQLIYFIWGLWLYNTTEWKIQGKKRDYSYRNLIATLNKRESRTLRVKSNVRPPTIKITNCSDGQESSKGRDQSHFTLPGFIHPFIHSFQGPPCSVDMNDKAHRLLLHLKYFQFCEEDGSNKEKFFWNFDIEYIGCSLRKNQN